ncbi:class I SAM-dependent methyltransferase [Candidatus Bipolaricaulota bacterium]|nr:class I SAM-dependent methyltransferase [Candidatus Bipolaricaulota bacterium]
MRDNPFETSAAIYDQWYDDFPAIFQSEVLALRALLPQPSRWVEIGVGTGRFAAELGIGTGIEPTEGMAVLARRRGIDVIRGVAEALPLASESMDCVFFITTLCFVRDLNMSIAEAFRVLKRGGCCIIGLLPLDSALGRMTQAHAADDLFFRNAQLRTRGEVLKGLEGAGFQFENSSQTLVGAPESFAHQVPAVQPGHDRGSFVVFRAAKPTRLASLISHLNGPAAT